MANDPRRWTTTVATALLAGSAVAAAAILARRRPHKPRAVIPALALTPSHRGGTGTPLLLLHGVGAIWRAWSPVLPYLEPHHDVIVPTLAGHGGGPPLDPDIAVSVHALADGIEDELDRLGLQKVHIAGNSLGGWIGIELARRGRALSLVLLSPAGAWRSPRRIELTAQRRQVLARCARSLLVPRRRDRRTPCCTGRFWPVKSPTPVASNGNLVTSIRASGQSPVVDPLLRVLPLRQVEPLPIERDYPVRLVWATVTG